MVFIFHLFKSPRFLGEVDARHSALVLLQWGINVDDVESLAEIRQVVIIHITHQIPATYITPAETINAIN